MDLKLKNKVIIVTGGSKGIGFGICKVLAQEGAIPVILGRNKTTIASAVKELKDAGGMVGFAFVELTHPEECKNAVASVLKEFGRIDGLVNNAGVNDGVSLADGGYANFMDSIHKNLMHYYLITHHALPALKKAKGVILNIGSKTSITGQGGTSGYAAANGGRNALTREWAVELLPFGIRVNAVIVAECYTPLYHSWIQSFKNPKEKLAAITKSIPLENRMTTTEEIGNTVAFLVSEKSSHTTGQLVYVDGGYTHLDRAITT